MMLASLTPLVDAERFGVVNTGKPKHADIFLVTGSVNAQYLPGALFHSEFAVPTIAAA